MRKITIELTEKQLEQVIDALQDREINLVECKTTFKKDSPGYLSVDEWRRTERKDVQTILSKFGYIHREARKS